MDINNLLNEFLIILLRLGLAFVLGGLVGYQREKADRPAGFRTHVLVAVGAAVFTLISISPLSDGGQTDPSRIASQIVVGIGFIGAGAIINQGDIVMGLTTAASLWVTAAIGMASGGGFYVIAAVTTIIVYLTLSAFKVVERRVSPGIEHGALFIEVVGDKSQLEQIEDTLKEADVHSRTFELSRAKEVSEYRFYVELPPSLSTRELISKMLEIDGVKKARWEGVLTGRTI